MNLQVSIHPKEYWTWESQVTQYPEKGEPGIGYYVGRVDGLPVDCLLYRDIEGDIIGILNHFPQDMRPEGKNGVVFIHREPVEIVEKKGNIKVWTHPNFKRRGIASDLLDEALKRWKIDLERQGYTPAGKKFVLGYLAKRSLVNGAHSRLDMEELERTRL